jgi:hypothetical protein
MTINELINELKKYPSKTKVVFKLVKDEWDENQDETITWVGEIDTSLLDSNEPTLEIGLESEVL